VRGLGCGFCQTRSQTGRPYRREALASGVRAEPSRSAAMRSLTPDHHARDDRNVEEALVRRPRYRRALPRARDSPRRPRVIGLPRWGWPLARTDEHVDGDEVVELGGVLEPA
jgi:hypothetical protein